FNFRLSNKQLQSMVAPPSIPSRQPPSTAMTATPATSLSTCPSIIDCDNCGKCHPGPKEACWSLKSNKSSQPSSRPQAHFIGGTDSNLDVGVEHSVDDGGEVMDNPPDATSTSVNVVLPLQLNDNFTVSHYSLPTEAMTDSED